MRSTLLLLPALFLPLLPVQAQDGARGAKRGGSGFSIQTGEACSGISREECCAQMLELAGLRAHGDYLPRTIKTTVILACSDETRTVTPQVCRSISTSRGFSPKEVDAICKPAQRDCSKHGTCKQCVSDLVRLDYQGSHHACQAVTYAAERMRSRVVVIKPAEAPDSDTRFEITRRRTLVR